MPRYTLTQALMGVALLAILLALTQAEGCGRRMTMVESLSFSSDGQEIGVSILSCRDARVPFKFYKQDLARTLSVVPSSSGTPARRVHEDVTRGNHGPAFDWWNPGRSSALLDSLDNSFIAHEFGGGYVARHDRESDEERVVVDPAYPVLNLAVSRSGRLVAASHSELTICEAASGKIINRIRSDEIFRPFTTSPLLEFSDDESRIITASDSGVYVWSIAEGRKLSTILEPSELWVNSISIAPDDTLVICSDDSVRRYDFSGNLISTLSERGMRRCDVSPDGRLVALASAQHLEIIDASNGRVVTTAKIAYATAIAFAPDGNSLAVGDYDGELRLLDIGSGEIRWSTRPPTRKGFPWTFPACMLIVWLYFAFRLAQKRL